MNKDVFKGEGKEVERKRKRNKVGGGGGLIVNIFFGVEIFSSGVFFFWGGDGLRYFRGGGGVKKFSGEGLRKKIFFGGGGWLRILVGLKNFRGGESRNSGECGDGLKNFRGWVEKFSGGLRNFRWEG